MIKGRVSSKQRNKDTSYIIQRPKKRNPTNIITTKLKQIKHCQAMQDSTNKTSFSSLNISEGLNHLNFLLKTLKGRQTEYYNLEGSRSAKKENPL